MPTDIAANALKAAVLGQISFFLRRRGPAQQRIAMGKTTKLRNHVAVGQSVVAKPIQFCSIHTRVDSSGGT